MDSNTGKIKHFEDSDAGRKQAKAEGFNVIVNRDLTEHELAKMQIDLYSPCVCGSGKKFKFCCKTNRK